MYDVVVIGGGAGGLNSSLYASRSGLSVAIVERGLYGGQLLNTSEVENLLGFGTVSGEELAESMEEQVMKLDNIEHIYGDVIDLIKINNVFETVLANGDRIKSRTAVIATGVKHRKLGVAGESHYEGRGISTCENCDGAFFKGESVVIIGGGNTAVEGALYMQNIAKDVTLVYRGDKLRAEKILQDRMNSKDNVTVVRNAETMYIGGDGNKVEFVDYIEKETNAVKRLEVQGVFVNVGMIPVTESFKLTDHRLLDEFGYVINNPRTMETQVSGLFAVGDVRADSVRQIASAVGDGSVAGINIKKYIETI